MTDPLLKYFRGLHLEIRDQVLTTWYNNWVIRTEDGVFDVMVKHHSHFLDMQLTQLLQEASIQPTISRIEQIKKNFELRKLCKNEVRAYIENMHEENIAFMVRFILYTNEGSVIDAFRDSRRIVYSKEILMKVFDAIDQSPS